MVLLVRQTPAQGCVLTLVNRAFTAEGWQVKLIFMPWPRTLKMLSQGKVDASAYWMDRPDRRKDYIFPESPVTSEVYRFVFRNDVKIEWESYEDLRGKTIIVNPEYTYTAEFYEARENFDIKTYAAKSEDLNLKMILKGRGLSQL